MSPAKRKKWRERRILFMEAAMKHAPQEFRVRKFNWRGRSDEVVTAAYRCVLLAEKFRKLDKRYPGAFNQAVASRGASQDTCRAPIVTAWSFRRGPVS
jgi:hypothetical protein